MKIGYACIPLAIRTKVSNRVILKNFSEETFLNAVRLNLSGLKNTLLYNAENNISMFRISSDTIPLSSHEINNIPWWDIFKKEFNELGDIIKANKMRVSMHPGQYTILNSPDNSIVYKATLDLEYHTKFLDLLNTEEDCKIILHVGGVYGDKPEAIRRFAKNYDSLSDGIKKRLIIENDERSYSIKDVIEIGKNLRIPIVFDNLHNECHSDKVDDLHWIFENVQKTWGNTKGPLKVHYSQQNKVKRKGAHSTTIIMDEFMRYYNIAKDYSPDIMLEVKDKNVSAIKCNRYLESLKGNDQINFITKEWAKYKYTMMERNYRYYKECSNIVNEEKSFKRFYEFIDEHILESPSPESFKNGVEHVWGYLKNLAKPREQQHLFNLIGKGEQLKIKNYIFKLCERYDIEYLLKSYYFIY